MAGRNSIPDYNQDFPDFGTKVLETWGREGNLAKEMAQRLLLASGNITEARRKDATNFEQAKELAALKQKYAKDLVNMRAASHASSEPSLDPNGNLLLSGSEALNFVTAGRGTIVGPGVDNKGKPKVIVKPVGADETVKLAPPAVAAYTDKGSNIPAPGVVQAPPPNGAPPAPAGLKPHTLSTGKVVFINPATGEVVNGPK
jgi:hypothetical protein